MIVVIQALVILFTGYRIADPIISVFIGVLVLFSSWKLLRDSVSILLEGSPPGIDAEQVGKKMAGAEGVEEVHDLHIWTVTSGLVAMSGHVEVTDERDWHDILLELSALLRSDFGIAHVTLQPEKRNTRCANTPSSASWCWPRSSRRRMSSPR